MDSSEGILENYRIRVAAMSDSPKLHSGFATVVERLYAGFHDAGMEVHVLGFMDAEHDFLHQFPYFFNPTTPLDELAHSTFGFFLRKVKPDVIFILTDPGNLAVYANGIVHNNAATYLRNGRDFIPPIVAYIPIEGTPLMDNHKASFEYVIQTGGKLVFYNNTAKGNVAAQWPEIAEQSYVVRHGLDHANFQRYSDEDRRILKELVGLGEYFVIGCVGANKRTKGFVELIYTAQQLRKMGCDKGIKFYCHTHQKEPTMMGYSLGEIADNCGVGDMFLWKQIRHQNNYWLGISRENGSLSSLKELAGKIPDKPEQRGFLFANLDYVSMMNTLDMYVDLSQNEGWGLCGGEAMACGVPTLMVNDYDVRREVYDGGVEWIEPLPKRCWGTLHTGARLVTVDPLEVAKVISLARENPIYLRDLTERGQKVATKYQWKTAQQQMTHIVKEAAQFVLEEDLAHAA